MSRFINIDVVIAFIDEEIRQLRHLKKTQPYEQQDGFDLRIGEAGLIREYVKHMPTENSEAYNKGLNDAWELARKIVLPESEGGMKIDELKNVFKNHSYFDINDILKRYPP